MFVAVRDLASSHLIMQLLLGLRHVGGAMQHVLELGDAERERHAERHEPPVAAPLAALGQRRQRHLQRRRAGVPLQPGRLPLQGVFCAGALLDGYGESVNYLFLL